MEHYQRAGEVKNFQQYELRVIHDDFSEAKQKKIKYRNEIEARGEFLSGKCWGELSMISKGSMINV